LQQQPDVVQRLGILVEQPIKLVEGDVRNTALLVQSLKDQSIAAVIHFAGLKAVGESVAEPIDYFANNIQGTISLLQAMLATDVKTLVFSSSSTVDGEPQYLPIDEDHSTCATNPYGRSKLLYMRFLSMSPSQTRLGVSLVCATSTPLGRMSRA
jgi:UDP-glucose 4-epimerase